MMAASGTRFGRTRIATAAARPDAAAATGASLKAKATAMAHAAAAGTSLIGAISMNSIVGLVATSDAAASPTHGRRRRHPIKYVANVSTPPASGTIQKIAHSPAIAFAAAMSIGR